MRALAETRPDGEPRRLMRLPHSRSEAERILELVPPGERLSAFGFAASREMAVSPELSRYRFRIEGHTDTAGEAPANLVLSERRAATVRDHLVNRHGVAASRLEASGLGETQLLVQTPDATSEPRNRRVQILNLGG